MTKRDKKGGLISTSDKQLENLRPLVKHKYIATLIEICLIKYLKSLSLNF